MDELAIKIENLSKAFKKYSRLKKFKTLKSALVRDLLHSAEKSISNKESKSSDKLFWALKEINLEIYKSSTLGVIGQNGAGKSTLLKLIAGLTKPTEGYITTFGQNDKKAKVSALIELGAGFHPEITGRENIFINGIMLGLSKKEIREKFNDIVEFAELKDFIDSPVRTYSSGMYMRLGFAVAVNVDPDILLIDEVFAVGDQAFSQKCIEKIQEFKSRKKTIILVSHDLAGIEKLCQDAIWIHQGKLQQQGVPRQVIDSYLTYLTGKEENALTQIHQKAVQVPVEKIAGLPVMGPELDKILQACRWGSQEVIISGIELFDPKQNPKHVFYSGEAITIRIHWKSSEIIKKPVFGVGFGWGNGVCCYGTNTQIDGILLESLNGTGYVDFHIPHLDLVEGFYFLDVAVHSEEGLHYDYHHRMYSFIVHSAIHDEGVWRPPHTWSFSSNIKW